MWGFGKKRKKDEEKKKQVKKTRGNHSVFKAANVIEKRKQRRQAILKELEE